MRYFNYRLNNNLKCAIYTCVSLNETERCMFAFLNAAPNREGGMGEASTINSDKLSIYASSSCDELPCDMR